MKRELQLSWYRFEVEESLKHYLFDQAKPTETKRAIMARLKREMDEMDKRGPRFFTLLFFTLSRYGLQKMQYPPKGPTKSFMEVIIDFVKEWDKSPKLRKAKVLAELL